MSTNVHFKRANLSVCNNKYSYTDIHHYEEHSNTVYDEETLTYQAKICEQ